MYFDNDNDKDKDKEDFSMRYPKEEEISPGIPSFIEYPEEPERPERRERRTPGGPSKKKGLKKKQIRNIFLAGFVTGALVGSIVTAILPDRKADKVVPPVIEEPVETPETAVETPVEPAVVPEELMEGRNHSNAAESYAYDIEEVKEWMTGGRSENKKTVFLTFDDGPGTYTREVLDVLKEKEVPANFFLLGSNAEKSSKSSDLWQRYIAEGHGIALHSYSHDYGVLYTERTPNIDKFIEEWDKSVAILKERLGEGFNTRILRFPGGSMSWRGMTETKAKLAEKNIYDLDWNAITGDTETKDKRPETAEKAWEMIQDGLARAPHPETVVLLMHDSKENTPKFLGELIEKFKTEGYEFGIMY